MILDKSIVFKVHDCLPNWSVESMRNPGRFSNSLIDGGRRNPGFGFENTVLTTCHYQMTWLNIRCWCRVGIDDYSCIGKGGGWQWSQDRIGTGNEVGRWR